MDEQLTIHGLSRPAYCEAMGLSKCFELQTAVDAVEKRITELHNENERGIVNMDGTVEKFNGEY